MPMAYMATLTHTSADGWQRLCGFDKVRTLRPINQKENTKNNVITAATSATAAATSKGDQLINERPSSFMKLLWICVNGSRLSMCHAHKRRHCTYTCTQSCSLMARSSRNVGFVVSFGVLCTIFLYKWTINVAKSPRHNVIHGSGPHVRKIVWRATTHLANGSFLFVTYTK